MTVRIAMWSGPRNISTAMMRAWENRADTTVWDEPLYGHYLHATGLDHPGAAEVMGAQSTDWREVVARCRGPAPGGKRVFFQKHMTHHMLDQVERDWMADVVNCFLIRRPVEVLASYIRARAEVTADDLGYVRQTELVATADALHGGTVVLEASDVLKDPRRSLGLLCEHVGVPFDEAMLRWPAGRRDTDGVWGPYWYDSVWASTGFVPYRAREPDVPRRLAHIIETCQPHYDALYARRLG